MKKCSKCKRRLPESCFCKNRCKKDGLHTECRECNRARVKGWQKSHTEHMRTTARLWRNRKKEWVASRHRLWASRNRNRQKIYDARYMERHPDRRRIVMLAQTHTRRLRMARAAKNGTYTFQEWLDLKASYGNRCLCCGDVEPDITLSPDHVVPIALGGDNTIDNIQPLCRKCNRRKSDRVIDYRQGAEVREYRKVKQLTLFDA